MDNATVSEEIVDQAELPGAPAPDAFAALFNLLALIADQRAFKARLNGLSRALEAVTSGEKKLAQCRAAFDAHEASARAELEKERAALRKRQVAVEIAEGELIERREWIIANEAKWRNAGETDDLVLRGVRAPERSPIQKARAAHRAAAEQPVHSGFDGGEFPAGVTITRSPVQEA